MTGLRPYIVQLSNKQEVKITSDELDAVIGGVQTGSMIRLRQAIINPSFIIAIVPDDETWDSHMMYVMGVVGSDEWHQKRQELADIGVKPTKDKFEKFLGIKQEKKQLADKFKMEV